MDLSPSWWQSPSNVDLEIIASSTSKTIISDAYFLASPERAKSSSTLFFFKLFFFARNSHDFVKMIARSEIMNSCWKRCLDSSNNFMRRRQNVFFHQIQGEFFFIFIKSYASPESVFFFYSWFSCKQVFKGIMILQGGYSETVKSSVLSAPCTNLSSLLRFMSSSFDSWLILR